MKLALSVEMTVVQALELRLLGGMTDSIFPEVEAWLQVTTDRQRALEWAASKKRMDRYESVMDFLFVETFDHFRPACRAYYKREGPQLKETITVAQRERFARTLLLVLQVAYDAYCAERRVTWGWVRDEAIRILPS